MNSDIEVRLERLEAESEILALKSRYQYFCDQGYDPDGIASLFVENGVWQTTGFGRHEGRAAIHQFMAGVSEDLPWAWHATSNPLIEVAGDRQSASGRWYSLVICEQLQADGSVLPAVMIGKYTDEFKRVDGKWLFSSVTVDLERKSTFEARLERPDNEPADSDLS